MISQLQPTQCRLILLPDDILFFLANYLIPAEEQNKKIFSFSQDWRNFMNTSKEHFTTWKKQSQVISLNWNYADRFLRTSKIRERILSTINNSQTQLDLNFPFPQWETLRPRTTKLRFTKGSVQVRKLILDDWAIVSCDVICSELYLQTQNRFETLPLHSNLVIIDASKHYFAELVANDLLVCSSLKRLSLFCRNLHNYHVVSSLTNLQKLALKNCHSVTDMTCFGNIPTLSLYRCPNCEVASLQNVHELELRSCESIEDVFVLKDFHCLKLGGCENVSDVSALGNVHYLDLSSCQNIVDVSALGNVHSLILNDCDKVLDLSALNNVYYLEFQYFKGNDVSGLKNVVHLDLFNSQNISDISMLKTVVFLNIHSYPKITSLSGLDNLKDLVFSTIKPFQGETILFQLRKAVLFSCVDENEIYLESGWVRNVRDLEFHGRMGPSIFFAFGWTSDLFSLTTSLTLENCQNFSCFSLPCLNCLKLRNCKFGREIFSLEDDPRNPNPSPIHRVEIENCSKLLKIEVSRKVFNMKVVNCRRLCYFEVKSQIAHLKIEGSPSLRGIAGYSNLVSAVINESSQVFEIDWQE
jgi:hypothetical protein